MADISSESMLARLHRPLHEGPDPWPGLAASQPRHEAPPSAGPRIAGCMPARRSPAAGNRPHPPRPAMPAAQAADAR